jgi:hypothetical protein
MHHTQPAKRAFGAESRFLPALNAGETPLSPRT